MEIDAFVTNPLTASNAWLGQVKASFDRQVLTANGSMMSILYIP